MCVTWFMINESPGENGYKLVLVYNRDEYFIKPTKSADYLDSNKDVLCGVDMRPGKEGGTWLGVSKKGKVACLLNIREPANSGWVTNKKLFGRGSLVTNFLTNDTDCTSYLRQLSGSDYNEFNLILMDFRKILNILFLFVKYFSLFLINFRQARPEVWYYSNTSEGEYSLLEPGCYGISNTPLYQPWPKATNGKKYLEELMKKNQTMSTDELTQTLLKYASRKEGEWEIPEGISFEDSLLVPEAAFFKSPDYGTRTTTVILINKKGEMTFTERTMVDPMDPNTKWSTKTFYLRTATVKPVITIPGLIQFKYNCCKTL
ncbi:transport and Golgi organization protein 2 homolog [Antedon mediterranea]|uniref:transport and Golgi organization protein 2 homolog n=1 Tax=Antedon mediterranea TaxID=105859 RepID=UPI003AF88F4F